VVSTLPPGYNNHDHAHAKNALGAPASGPNSPPAQTNSCADIHVTPNGRFVYGSNRGHDSLVCFAIGSSSAEEPLTLVGWTSTHGEHPRNFGIHPSGRWLVRRIARGVPCAQRMYRVTHTRARTHAHTHLISSC
jgi:hypothetical protein